MAKLNFGGVEENVIIREEFPLEKAREIGLEKVLVTCREDNIGSIKIIESNSGKYENSYYDESLRKAYRRYWIQCG